MREWLKKFRQEKGYTISEVSTKAQISESYYSKIESGERNCPVPTAKKIAEVLGFSWQKFFE